MPSIPLPAPPLPPIGPHHPWLAPLAGYSDLPFRLLCREYGASVAVTEMISARGMRYNSHGTAALLATCRQDDPLVVQLFGCEVEDLRHAVAEIAAMGYTTFDLNCGCSVRKVTKTGCGAALLADVDHLARLVEAMKGAAKGAAPIRLGVKLRLGVREQEDVLAELPARLEDAGADWLTLHPRYAKQGFTGQAHWTRLAELKRATRLPVLGSGDLLCAADGHAMQQQTGIDGVMYARGALADPRIFSAHRALQAGDKAPPPTAADTAQLIRRHVELIHSHGNPTRELVKMRSIIPRYVRHLPGARAIRTRMVQCSAWQDLHQIVRDLEQMDEQNVVRK